MSSIRLAIIRRVARRVRKAAERFARAKGYCPATLVTMCSTVAPVLARELELHGIRSSVVAGTFCHLGHFWVETDDGVIVDVTATQFETRTNTPKVLIAAPFKTWAQNYDPVVRGWELAGLIVQAHDRDDIAEFGAWTI